jgi:hypothetical protein
VIQFFILRLWRDNLVLLSSWLQQSGPKILNSVWTSPTGYHSLAKRGIIMQFQVIVAIGWSNSIDGGNEQRLRGRNGCFIGRWCQCQCYP